VNSRNKYDDTDKKFAGIIRDDSLLSSAEFAKNIVSSDVEKIWLIQKNVEFYRRIKHIVR